MPGQIIVKFKDDTGPAIQADARRDEGLKKVKDLMNKVRGQSVERAIRELERLPSVEYAEPDYVVYPAGYADEPRFGELWGLHNTGQAIDGSTGTPTVDVNGLEASNVTLGDPNLVVAVIDDGVDFSHLDLAGRHWKSPGESGSGKETNGIDDDGNGKVELWRFWRRRSEKDRTPLRLRDHHDPKPKTTRRPIPCPSVPAPLTPHSTRTAGRTPPLPPEGHSSSWR